jgi:hypothetical protein
VRGVADKLVDDPALVENDVHHALQIVIEEADYVLRGASSR